MASAVLRCHRRTQSLPSSESHEGGAAAAAKSPDHHMLATVFTGLTAKSYRFHSGLGGDISVEEVMGESKLSFAFPQQLL